MAQETDLPEPPKPELIVRLASPRGFCAGVERAVRTVEDALARYGAPIFVRHEIVHNRHVVRRLEAMGAVFLESLEGAPAGRPVIFSAHRDPSLRKRTPAVFMRSTRPARSSPKSTMKCAGMPVLAGM
jgi:hypothetical protein